MLNTCWTTSGSSQFAPALCSEGEVATVIEWDALPLVVIADPALAYPVQQSISVWNEWLGFEALRFAFNDTDPDIVITYLGRVPDPNLAGLTMFQKTADGKMHSMIGITSLGRHSPTTYIHEIGHALGLAHDPENPRSIMHPSLSGMYGGKLEIKDRAALRHRYYFKRKALK